MVTNEEILEHLPVGPQFATITTDDGAVPVRDMPASSPSLQEGGMSTTALEGLGAEPGTPVITLSWADGSDYIVYWPTTAISVDGEVTSITGPRGVLQLRRRNA